MCANEPRRPLQKICVVRGAYGRTTGAGPHPLGACAGVHPWRRGARTWAAPRTSPRTIGFGRANACAGHPRATLLQKHNIPVQRRFGCARTPSATIAAC
jgi:hypothetical protein